MIFLKIYIMLLISVMLIVKLIAIITKKYPYTIKYFLGCLLIFYLPILIYTIFS